MALDQVSLIVPARSEYAKTVRLTAAELGSRLGMSYDDVDDVRMATEEAFVYASACVGESEPIGFTFTVAEDELTVLVGLSPRSVAATRTPAWRTVTPLSSSNRCAIPMRFFAAQARARCGSSSASRTPRRRSDGAADHTQGESPTGLGQEPDA